MAANWTPPATWTGSLITVNRLNEQIRDNLEFLKDPPSASYEADEGSNYTTTSSSFVDVDSTNLSLTIETAGGDVLIAFHGTVTRSASGGIVRFDVDVDGTRVASDDGIIAAEPVTGAGMPVSFVRYVTGLSPGSHTFKLQWKINTGTATLYAGAGTSQYDIHPQMWVREVS